MRKRIRIPVADRFWRYVNKTDTCWLWTGCTRNFGYGVINLGGKHGKAERAHRLSWILHNGPIPEKMFVCHHCDNPLCVRPDHLFLGTPAANNHDMAMKGRYDKVKRPKGERHGRSKLTDADVLSIRAAYDVPVVTITTLGEEYGVSAQTIYRIILGNTWARGSTVPLHRNAKLTHADVASIRARYTARRPILRELAEQYGVHIATIHHIVRHENWKHL